MKKILLYIGIILFLAVITLISIKLYYYDDNPQFGLYGPGDKNYDEISKILENGRPTDELP